MQDWAIFGAVVMRGLTGVDKNTNLFLPWNVLEFVNMQYLGILNREVIRINNATVTLHSCKMCSCS